MQQATHPLSDVATDFAKVAHLLREAAYELCRRKLTAYPLFMCATKAPKMGVCLVKAGEHATAFHYHVSSLEELVSVGLVTDKQAFIKTYKEPEEYSCLLVLRPEETHYLFLPYPEEQEG